MANDVLDHNGNSLRDSFAQAALPAFLAQLYWTVNHNGVEYDSIYKVAAEAAYEAADAMLVARKIKDPPEPDDLVSLDEWSTMSSAPKDGRMIRAYWPRSSTLYIKGGRLAHWYEHGGAGLWVPWQSVLTFNFQDQPTCWQPITTEASDGG